MRSTPNTKSPLPFWTDRKKTSLGRLKGGNLVGFPRAEGGRRKTARDTSSIPGSFDIGR